MIGDCKKYLGEAGSEFKHDGFGNFEKALQNVLSSLIAFERFLSSIFLLFLIDDLLLHHLRPA